MSRIIYTKTDEAPALATQSLLPIIKSFTSKAGIEIELKDISLASRVLSAFPEYLNEDQRHEDALAYLGELATKPHANIIKLPNISASIPQLTETIKELQEKGFNLPDYPEDAQNEKEEAIKARYNKVKGSAVNPVLREGNSDRRAPKPVKAYAQKYPHKMGSWSADSKTHVATMGKDDFRSNEKSVTLKDASNVKIVFTSQANEQSVLRSGLQLEKGELIDATFMSRKALDQFLEAQIKDAKQKGVLFSLHMKATMMKVSDPVIFGRAVEVFFADVFQKYAQVFEEIGVDSTNGFGDVLAKIETLEDSVKQEILNEIQKAYQNGPNIAMVNSDQGITNLHVPSDVIIDASVPAMIRTSGKMWNAQGELEDAKVTIPDSSYAGIYAATIDFCKQHGAFDPTTMGSVSNVGLMAKKAEEYGSHDKTFVIEQAGIVQVIDQQNNVLLEHKVEQGDIWRMCQTKDAPIKDWVKLAVSRAKATGDPAVFWLDRQRAHDAELIKKVNTYLPEFTDDHVQTHILSPIKACEFTLQRVKDSKNTISVTGNVLRDYLTDLFPILELGTSAKMLSIVPLMNGGGLFETGAGGSAPKHVDQFTSENHLRWDSLGEFLALAVSLEFLGEKQNNTQAKILADCLDQATIHLLNNQKSPLRKVGELDNRGSHFYLAMYWAKELAIQTNDSELAVTFKPLADLLEINEQQIVNELNLVQGKAVDMGGYYLPDDQKIEAAMRPSKTFNQALAQF